MNYLKIGLTIIAIIVLLFCLMTVSIWWQSRMPTDNQIVQYFDKNKGTFDELLNKLSHEPVDIVGFTEDKVMKNTVNNWIAPENAGISDQHFSEYSALMKNAHITQIWRYEGATNFNIAAYGFASAGWRLALTYSTSKPSPLVQSIDLAIQSPPEDRTPIYRPLSGNWYIRLIQ